MSKKVLVLIADYRTSTGDHEACLLDMLIDTYPNTINDVADHVHNRVKEYAALHANFFTLLGAIDPHISTITAPLITTEVGKKQLKDAIKQHVTTTIVDADFERLFTSMLEASETKAS